MQESTEVYVALLKSQGWKDFESVVRERMSEIDKMLHNMHNTREQDIELKARHYELKTMLDLPHLSVAIIELYKQMKELSNGRDEQQQQQPINAERGGRGPALRYNDAGPDGTIGTANTNYSRDAGTANW